MIKLTFKNWELAAEAASRPPYQHDDNTAVISVTGDIPDGWAWDLLIAIDDNIDVAHMDYADGALTVTLSAEQLAYTGYYALQLRATQGGFIKHTSQIMKYIGPTISGDAHWPEVPTAFTQALNRAEAAIADAQEVQTAVAESETAAAQSAGDAAGSAAAAAQSATTATQSATDAGAYATSAAGSAESASQSATSATASATAASAAVSHYPHISTTTGNWEVWDAETPGWVDTGVHAQGDPGAVQDVRVDGQSVLDGGVAAVSSASVAKSGMTGASPEWSQAEQLSARQRLGIDKEFEIAYIQTLGEVTSNVAVDLDKDYSEYRIEMSLPVMPSKQLIQVKVSGSLTSNGSVVQYLNNAGDATYPYQSKVFIYNSWSNLACERYSGYGFAGTYPSQVIGAHNAAAISSIYRVSVASIRRIVFDAASGFPVGTIFRVLVR